MPSLDAGASVPFYDWNRETPRKAPAGNISILDETLRDGLQNPSVTDPPLDQKIALLHRMDGLGIDVANLGLPGSCQRQYEDVLAGCREIQRCGLRIRPSAAGRTVVADLVPIAEITQRVGIAVEAYTFIGSSPIRQFVEAWDLDRIMRHTAEAIAFGVREGLSVCFVTEDTTRSRPDVLEILFRTAVDNGATALCLADTVGHATPDGARALIGFTRALLKRMGAEHVRIDWHGHNDRGLALQNALWAIEVGADRIHGTALGIGERVGNVSMELLLLNLMKLGWRKEQPRQALLEYCELASKALGWTIPSNHPLWSHEAPRGFLCSGRDGEVDSSGEFGRTIATES